MSSLDAAQYGNPMGSRMPAGRGLTPSGMCAQVYGEASVGSEVGLHEHSTLEPTNPYSAAKAGAEMMVRLRLLGGSKPCM